MKNSIKSQNLFEMSKKEDNPDSANSSANTRKNTILSNTASIGGRSIMEDEDATKTTIAIGNETYTIGEICLYFHKKDT